LHGHRQGTLPFIEPFAKALAEFLLPENALQIAVLEQSSNHWVCDLQILRAFVELFAQFIA